LSADRHLPCRATTAQATTGERGGSPLEDRDDFLAIPTVVPISDLRRHAARFVDRVCRAHAHLIITQRGYATAVLLSLEDYKVLRRCQEQRAHEILARPATHGAPPAEDRPPPMSYFQMERPAEDLLCRPYWTRHGWCDYESARTLAERGIETELILTDEGWLPDDEG
jgi:prevent-host-death family protein